MARGNVFILSTGYGLSTECLQSTGPENVGPERPLPGLLARGPVLSPPRITLENNEKIRPQPDWEKAFAGASGGGNATAVEPSLGHVPSGGDFFIPSVIASVEPTHGAERGATRRSASRIAALIGILLKAVASINTDVARHWKHAACPWRPRTCRPTELIPTFWTRTSQTSGKPALTGDMKSKAR